MSQAVELTRWIKHREADLRNARSFVRMVRRFDFADKRTRAIYLNGLHAAIEIIKIDNRMIAFETAQLNLCDCHHSGESCDTVPTF